jgi:hypothetical protein
LTSALPSIVSARSLPSISPASREARGCPRLHLNEADHQEDDEVAVGEL